MGLKISKFIRLVERIRLQIDSRRIDMGNIEMNSFVQRPLSQCHEEEVLSPIYKVKFVSRFSFHTALKRLIPCFLRKRNTVGYTLSFNLRMI